MQLYPVRFVPYSVIRNVHMKMTNAPQKLPIKMTETRSSGKNCPVGEANCAYIDEVAALRDKVDQLAALVHTDPLTGIANFRYFNQALEQETERTRRTGQPMALVMLDIDFFKKINDSWGHEVGNKALIHIAQLIRNSMRKFDIPCRYGGEEFGIILPGTDLAGSIELAERMRKIIEAAPLRVADKDLFMTASLGIQVYCAGQPDTAEDLVEKADQYLYRAKNEGRNRTCHAPLKPIEDISSVSQDEKEVLFNLFSSKCLEEDPPQE